VSEIPFDVQLKPDVSNFLGVEVKPGHRTSVFDCHHFALLKSSPGDAIDDRLDSAVA
jgi:hypothetical protein